MEQSNLAACCNAALTGLIAHSGRGNPDATCRRAIEIGTIMADKLDRLETTRAAIAIDEHEAAIADA